MCGSSDKAWGQNSETENEDGSETQKVRLRHT